MNKNTLTKEQLEIIEFTRKEFDGDIRAYAVLCIVACMKWPEHTDLFKKTFYNTWKHKYE